jgi:hypothetical protein
VSIGCTADRDEEVDEGDSALENGAGWLPTGLKNGMYDTSNGMLYAGNTGFAGNAQEIRVSYFRNYEPPSVFTCDARVDITAEGLSATGSAQTGCRVKIRATNDTIEIDPSRESRAPSLKFLRRADGALDGSYVDARFRSEATLEIASSTASAITYTFRPASGIVYRGKATLRSEPKDFVYATEIERCDAELALYRWQGKFHFQIRRGPKAPAERCSALLDNTSFALRVSGDK